MTYTESNPDQRNHLQSMLMRESLLDREIQKSTEPQSGEAPVVRMLPNSHVVKIGGRSILDVGRSLMNPLIEAIGTCLDSKKMILGTGGGARSRHVFSIGIDLGMPAGVLAQLAQADALGNAHILGALLASRGVVAIPPEIFGHLLPLFINSVPGVIFTGVPPYALWEHPSEVGRIPSHRSDAGCFLLAECFGCKTLTFVKDVDGLYDRDPKLDSTANFIPKISVGELKERNLETLPFERILIDLLHNSRLVDKFQIINGAVPERLEAALNGEHVGTIIYK